MRAPRGTGGQFARRAAGRAQAGSTAAGVLSTGTESRKTAQKPANRQETACAEAGGEWRLWFGVRLGPGRKRTIDGQRVKTRALELPPTKNTRDGSHYGHNAWVQEWRTAAWAAAVAYGIPPCERIRLSAVVYRARLGIADAENDHARLAPLQDGLVDAGVVPKDTYRYVERGEVREERAGADGPGILLIVESVVQ